MSLCFAYRRHINLKKKMYKIKGKDKFIFALISISKYVLGILKKLINFVTFEKLFILFL